jgi:hypothetical protein
MGGFCFSPAQRDKKTIHRQTEQNESSERGKAGAAGSASAKHALCFGAQQALVPNGLHKARSMGRPPLRTEVGSKPRQHRIGVADSF